MVIVERFPGGNHAVVSNEDKVPCPMTQNNASDMIPRIRCNDTVNVTANGKQPKRVKFTNCSQFLSHTFFGLDFHFYVIFLLIGIGQLDNDVLKKCSSKNINSFSLTKSTIELECELRYCDEVYLHILISYKTEIFKSFYSIHLYMDLLLIK